MNRKIVSGIAIFVSALLLLTFGAFTASIGAEIFHDKTTDAMGETADSFQLFESPTSKSLFKVAWKPDGSYALLIARDPHTYGAEIFNFDGNSCTLLLNDSNIIIQDVSWNPNGSYALFTVHYYADENHRYKILKYDGDYFSTIQEGGTDDMIAMDWKPDGSYALIVGGTWDAGIVWKYNGNSLTSISNSSFSKFILVDWKPDGSYALIVDFFGAVCKFDGTTFTKLSEVSTTPEHDVGWSADGSYALITGWYALEWDGHLVVLKFDGIQFTDITYQTETTNRLYGVSSSITGGTLVVGRAGTVLKYDGSIFTKLTEGIYGWLIDVAWKPGYNRALIVGDETILLYTPASEEPIYIRADGSIDPLAPISTVDNITYTFTDNIYDSIVVERDNIVVDGAGYTVQGTGSGTGMTLSGRSNITIKNANIKSFSGGIYLYSSSNNSISGNTITNNGWTGIDLYDSSNNSIVGNTITNNADGIYLRSSSYNRISGNLFVNDGLVVVDSYGNVVVDNLVNGKPLVYFEGMSHVNVVEAGQVILVNCEYIRVENLSLSYTTVGLQLLRTESTIISGNTITNNGWTGIDLYDSSNNSIVGNTITNNEWHGIMLSSSSYNSISANTITDNGYGTGEYVGSGIWLGSSSYNSISANTITDNKCGIWLGGSSSNNSISGNTITVNVYGILLLDSCNNNGISENTIANNWHGIEIWFSSDNKFYHNNFVDNTQQVWMLNESGYANVWDDGYPSGGNYWSDYTGVDIYSGQYQNETGSDGIGDTPYVINADNKDRYPLVVHDVAVTEVKPSKTIVCQSYSLNINVTVANQGNCIETFNVTAYANATVIDTLADITLTSRTSATVTFTWNTTGFAKGKYTIRAYAWPVPGETYTADNTLMHGTVYVGIPGDVDGNGNVDILDIATIARAYGAYPGHAKWNPNADLDDSNLIDIIDIAKAAKNYGKTDPKSPWA